MKKTNPNRIISYNEAKMFTNKEYNLLKQQASNERKRIKKSYNLIEESNISQKIIAKVMIEQDHGSIFNVEGHGSNDAIIPGLSIYGTAKRGVTYFTMALAKEIESVNASVMVGRLSPGIMITDFLVNAFRNKKMKLSEKNKKVYNILGDYPDVVAKYLVKKMIENTNNNVKINWLTNRKAAWRFMTCMFNKRDFFKEK